MDRIATKDSWGYYPMKNPKKIPINLIFNEEQYKKIKIGFIPSMMEEKWFVFFEDGWVHWVRSWTGAEWVKAEIKKENDKYIMSEFFLEAGVSEENDIKKDAEIFESFMNVLISGLDGRIYVLIENALKREYEWF